jgi:hypothetical protein
MPKVSSTTTKGLFILARKCSKQQNGTKQIEEK